MVVKKKRPPPKGFNLDYSKEPTCKGQANTHFGYHVYMGETKSFTGEDTGKIKCIYCGEEK